MLVTAFVRAATSARWDQPGLFLAAAGAAIVLATIVWNRDEVAAWFRDPRGVFAVTTGITAAVLVAILVLLNIVVWYNPWSVDLTASGRNQVSDGTLQMLRRLDVPVALQQFGRTPDPSVEKLLQAFARESRQIRVEFVDVDRDRDRASRFGVIRLGTVVVAAGEKFRKVEDASEQALVTAILQTTTEVERTVCFVTGHGERGLTDEGGGGLSQLGSTLRISNYQTERVSLLEDVVPSTCAVLVLAGAREALSSTEFDRLQSYLASSGRVALLIEPDPAPSFRDWLRPLGVVPGDGVVIDTSGAGQSVGGGPRTPLALGYADHPVTRGFEIATMYAGARALQVEEAQVGQAVGLAQTGPRSFATTDGSPEPTFSDGRDTLGPLTLAAAAVVGWGRPAGQEARLAVFGDSDFVSNAFLGRQGNRDFFLRSLAWLMGEGESAIVAVDSGENRRVELTESMRTWMYVVNVGVLPLLPLLAGVLVYVRSRR
jgi:ABC-type uncharacterized transport system involved in gliding motility auxiliary subunit